nr:SDR family oxidoreductase [Clostridiales bacterium]
GEENNRFLVGYYTASREITPAELKAEIGKTLTPYMVPGVLMQLDRMPLTVNGKIDKKKLPKVEYTPAAEEYTAPANAAEEDFCRWFAEVLNMDRVSADGNFFELGGTSLSAAVIALNAADRGYPIVYADVFKAQTPRELAALASSAGPAEPAGIAQDDLKRFDYSALKLSHNTADYLPGLTRSSVGNLLLTGATGFLGIHLLREYLQNSQGNVICLLRGEAPEKHLSTLYFYYFDHSLDPYFENGRVRVVPGDITDRASLEALKSMPFDTLINCAALVKHFVHDDSLEKINFRGVENLIALCEETGRRLIQTSTVSVAGEGLDGEPPRDWVLTEDALYNGQLLENEYALTKFKAERAVLEAVGRGVDAKVMRLGNLMGRASDGEFQVNFRSNAFIRSLASYKAIGAVPYSVMNAETSFSEIDMTARAILLLSGTGRDFTVFHPVNNHAVTYADIVYSMREYGFAMDEVEDEVFEKRMAEAGEVSGALIAYQNREGSARRYELSADCSFTTSALYRLGFKWPVSGEKYIVKMIKTLDELTMFEE